MNYLGPARAEEELGVQLHCCTIYTSDRSYLFHIAEELSFSLGLESVFTQSFAPQVHFSAGSAMIPSQQPGNLR